MQLDHTLQILICLAVIYFLFSSLVSIILEWLSRKTQQRGKMLHHAINKLLHDSVNQSFGSTLYSHYLIDRLKKDKDSYPQYISSSVFADALIDVIGNINEDIKFNQQLKTDGSNNIEKVELIENRNSSPLERFKQGLEKMNYSPLKNTLRLFTEKTSNYQELKKEITNWYEDYMDRVTGWYKYNTKISLFCIGLVVCLVFNVNSFQLVKKLNTDDNLRKQLLTESSHIVNQQKNKIAQKDSSKSSSEITLSDINKKIDSIEDLSIPIGYHTDFIWCKSNLEKKDAFGIVIDTFWWIFGILISALAVSFGAPFWFDVLMKAVNLRSAGIKPKDE